MTEKTKPTPIALDKIQLDRGTQNRLEPSEATAKEYAENVKALPPVDVFKDAEGTYILADGFHRHRAHQIAGKKTIKCWIHQGSEKDAVLFSAGANATHGLRLTHNDKLRAVTKVLLHEDAKGWSARKVAAHCGVSPDFVARVIEGRKEAEEARRVSSNDSPPAESVAGSIEVGGQRHPVIKPKKRGKRGGQKMGFENVQSRTPDRDEDGNEIGVGTDEPGYCPEHRVTYQDECPECTAEAEADDPEQGATSGELYGEGAGTGTTAQEVAGAINEALDGAGFEGVRAHAPPPTEPDIYWPGKVECVGVEIYASDMDGNTVAVPADRLKKEKLRELHLHLVSSQPEGFYTEAELQELFTAMLEART